MRRDGDHRPGTRNELLAGARSPTNHLIGVAVAPLPGDRANATERTVDIDFSCHGPDAILTCLDHRQVSVVACAP